MIIFRIDSGANFSISSRKVIIEGDILKEESRVTALEFRTVLSEVSRKWPNGVVPYTIPYPDYYRPEDIRLIREAMDAVESYAPCVTFREKTDLDEDYLVIKADSIMGDDDRSGSTRWLCYSAVGRQGGPQLMSLATPECMHKGTIMHELLHVLGFVHEQTRPDRDNYVKINWDNVAQVNWKNFQSYPTPEVERFGQPYDYKSIMHYDAYAFARDKRVPSIEPLSDDVALQDLGSAKRSSSLTDIDVYKLNKYYNCPDNYYFLFFE